MDEDEVEKITASFGFSGLIRQITKPKEVSQFPTKLSSALVTWSVTAYIVIALIFSFIINWMEIEKWYTILLLVIFAVILIGILVMISRQPRSTKELSFTVPLVPWLPALSILINVYLMTQLDYQTWIRFVVWIAVGLLIYFCYGVFHSQLRYRKIPSDNATADEEDEDVRAISQSTETVATTAEIHPHKS